MSNNTLTVNFTPKTTMSLTGIG